MQSLLDHVAAIADRIVKPEMLSVLLAYDLPRCRLKIVFRPHRCGAKRATFLIIDVQQTAGDRIAGFDDLARIILVRVGAPDRTAHTTTGRAGGRLWRRLLDRRILAPTECRQR